MDFKNGFHIRSLGYLFYFVCPLWLYYYSILLTIMYVDTPLISLSDSLDFLCKKV